MIETKKYKPSENSYRNYLRKELLNNSRTPKVITLICLFCIAAISIYGYLKLGNHKVLIAWLPFMGVILIFWLYALFFMPYVSSKTKYNTLSFAEWKYSFHETHFEAISEQGLNISGPYSMLPKISANEDYLMIYINYAFSLVVPKEAFLNEEDFHKVKSYF